MGSEVGNGLHSGQWFLGWAIVSEKEVVSYEITKRALISMVGNFPDVLNGF